VEFTTLLVTVEFIYYEIKADTEGANWKKNCDITLVTLTSSHNCIFEVRLRHN